MSTVWSDACVCVDRDMGMRTVTPRCEMTGRRKRNGPQGMHDATDIESHADQHLISLCESVTFVTGCGVSGRYACWLYGAQGRALTKWTPPVKAPRAAMAEGHRWPHMTGENLQIARARLLVCICAARHRRARVCAMGVTK